ncbi:hypothetical protein YC2023_098885 [Brassica napus]
MGGIREYMIQYANCPDRTESAARKERLRQAEEQGEIEETALQMVRASLATHTDEPPSEKSPTSADRVPAKHRLGPTPSAKLRLGPAPGPSPEPAIKKETRETSRHKEGRGESYSFNWYKPTQA